MRMSSENLIDDMSGVGKPTAYKKINHTCSYSHTAWSLEFAEPQVSGALAMHMRAMPQTNFPCLQSL